MTETNRTSHKGFFAGFLLHIHPKMVPAETIRFSLSLGLGGMTAVLVVVLFATGLLQLLMYVPSTTYAYTSVLEMYHRVPFGGWVRNIHYWAGNLLVLVTSLHLLRVFLTGALDRGRQLNWVVGLFLLCLVLFANFTGYLLPWDQLAYWAVTIFTGMFAYIPFFGTDLMLLLRGGPEVGPATLALFYALHVSLVPLGLGILCIWHFWLVRKAGGLVRVPTLPPEKLTRVPTVPALIRREATVGLLVLAALLLFAALNDAPLADPANPGLSPNPAKGAWYLVGLQELLLHMNPIIAICVIPALFFLALAAIPFVGNTVLPGGVWFGGSGRCLRTGIIVFASGLVCTVAIVLVDDTWLRTAQSAPSAVDLWMRGLVPLTGYLVLLLAVAMFLSKKWRMTRSEIVMATLLFHLALLVSLTVIGIWFRGEGMRLIWPL